MLTTERHKRILDHLDHAGSASIKELSEVVGTSESTIRRDLKTLDEEGRLRRVYGGAAHIEQNFLSEESAVQEKEGLFHAEKRLIGEKAQKLIKPGDFVFIDGGTTTEALAYAIKEKEATYVTDGLFHAQILLSKGLKVVMLGGTMRPLTEVACGAMTLDQLSRYNFSIGFFGVNGISQEAGYSTPDLTEGAVKEMAMKRSRNAYVLADPSKFGKIYAFSFGLLNQAQIITTKREHDYFYEYTKITEADA